jgi:hypothetical protein
MTKKNVLLRLLRRARHSASVGRIQARHSAKANSAFKSTKMKRFYFFCSRSTRDCYAVDPKTLYMCQLITAGTGQLVYRRCTPQSLYLNGLYKMRRAHAWELEPLRQALETAFKEQIIPYTTQPPSYVVHFLAGETTAGLDEDRKTERERIAKKRRTNRRNNLKKGIRPYDKVKQRNERQKQITLAQSAIRNESEEE